MKKRMHNIFAEDGKTFILAFDHGTVLNIGEHAPDPARIINDAHESGVDTFLTTVGVAESYTNEIGDMGLILRIDGGTTHVNPCGKVFEQVYSGFSVEDCNRVGSDGVIAMQFTQMDEEVSYLKRCTWYYSECKKYGQVLCLEAVPGGFSYPEYVTVENVGFAVRLACELGADFVKAPFVGNAEDYKKVVVDRCYKPLVVLGGGGKKTDMEILTEIKTAMDAGCKGVAYGRAIWGHQNVKGICSAISRIIHDDATVEQALKLIG